MLASIYACLYIFVLVLYIYTAMYVCIYACFTINNRNKMNLIIGMLHYKPNSIGLLVLFIFSSFQYFNQWCNGIPFSEPDALLPSRSVRCSSPTRRYYSLSIAPLMSAKVNSARVEY